MHFPVLIIGAGPAGIASAIQLRQSGIDFRIITDSKVGGLLPNAFCIENYPGIPPSSGRELTKAFQGHLFRSFVEVFFDRITKMVRKEENGVLESHGGNTVYTSDYAIIATGTLPKRIPEFEIPNKSFYHVSEMEHVKKQTVAIIGSGEAAYDSALSLVGNDNLVSIYSKTKPTAFISRTLREKVHHRREINIHKGMADKITLNGSCLEISTGRSKFHADCLLICSGRISSIPDLEPDSLISHPSLYVCGAARSGRLGQTGMAVGDGISAAMDISSCNIRNEHK